MASSDTFILQFMLELFGFISLLGPERTDIGVGFVLGTLGVEFVLGTLGVEFVDCNPSFGRFAASFVASCSSGETGVLSSCFAYLCSLGLLTGLKNHHLDWRPVEIVRIGWKSVELPGFA